MTPKDFQKTILDAVEEGLATLGESPKQAILFHLENTFRLKREEIPENLKEFKKALEKIFGPGSLYLERLIVERLCDKLSLKTKIESPDLLDNVEELKKLILSPG